MTDNLARNLSQNAIHTPHYSESSTTLSAQSTIRLISHLSRHGGKAIALQAAARYFNTDHPYYRALERLPAATTKPLNRNQRAKLRVTRSFYNRKLEIAALSGGKPRRRSIDPRLSPRHRAIEECVRTFG